MPKPRLNAAREHRIRREIVVDAYDETERAMSWYYYLEERLAAQFEARVRVERSTSPLRVGDQVNVLGMAPDDVCECDMLVWVRWSNRRFAVPLSQLAPLVDDEKIVQAVADWHYWVERGYEF